MFKGKTVVLGVTGSIAAYKIANLASMLVKQHAEVHVIMTKNATNFIHPIAFESLTNTKCLVETFDRNFQFHVAHVSVANKADVMMIAPASANVIGKLANGIADDMLTTTAMAFHGPMYIAPAMNTHMFENEILQDNLKKLERYGKKIIQPASGMLACRDIGSGKMPEPEELFSYIEHALLSSNELKGKKVLITAGPTREAIDPVRFISNNSTGKMGYALAKAASLKGGDVTLVSGLCEQKPPLGVHMVNVISASEMAEAVFSRSDEADIVIMTAAVADYTPLVTADQKIKKSDSDMKIELKRTTDILGTLGANKKPNQFLCGFCMETEDTVNRASAKLKKKNLDMIVANNLKITGAGFGTDTNVVTIIEQNAKHELPLLTKLEVSMTIIDKIVKILS